jgi:hypothetical protein
VADANQRCLAQVYLDLLQRPADPIGLAGWTSLLSQGISRAQVVADIEASSEYLTLVVQGLYGFYLARPADSAGLNGFVQFLSSGGTIEALKSTFLGSAEYFALAGGTNDAFLNAIYRDALGRAIDFTGSMIFGADLMAGISRSAVASAIFTSGEADVDLVQGFYHALLRRSAESFGLNIFVNALQQGVLDQDIVAAIAGSGEYFGRL